MPSLLVILLTISLTVVVAGLLLSYKPYVRSQRIVPTHHMGRPVIVVESIPTRTRSIVQSKHLIVRSSPLEIERYTGASVALPITIDHGFEQIQINKPLPWAPMIISLVAIFLFGFYSLNFLFPHHTNWSLMMLYGSSPSNAQSTAQSSKNIPQFNATQSLVRLSQLDPTQYASIQEFNTWAYSACSSAALTEVLNAYGNHFRVTDVLKVETRIGEITPQLGLLHEVGIQQTAAQFGFKTTWGHNLSLDQIINIANQGRPVIVSFPPDRYAGGHLLVVTGGNSSIVKLADSSLWNRQSLSRAQFLQWWEGFYAIVTPK
jgi:Peptidase_C39 like family